jgi:opacity protein-like surface antigen
MSRLRRCVLLAVPVVALTAASAHAQWVITPYLGMNVAGDAEFRRGGPGGSLDHLGTRLGLEVDVLRYNHFFKDSEVSPRDPTAPPNCTSAVQAGRRCTDIDTDAVSVMGNVLVPIRFRGATKWNPYGSAGLGLIRAWTNEADRSQSNLAYNAGVGLMYALSTRVGLRGELRYFRALVDEVQTEGILFRDYGFVRVSFGVTLRFPR